MDAVLLRTIDGSRICNSAIQWLLVHSLTQMMQGKFNFKAANGHAQNDMQNGRTAIKSTEQLYVDGIFDARIFCGVVILG